MTDKLHLPARPANEGARQLARWIMRDFRGSILAAAWAVPGCSSAMLDRLLFGDLVPGEELIEPLAIAGRVEPRAWRRPPAGGWFDAEPALVA